MRYCLAAMVAVFLTAGMFVFRSAMARRLDLWSTQEMELTSAQKLLVRASRVIASYWYILVPLVWLLCFVCAALAGDGSDGADE